MNIGYIRASSARQDMVGQEMRMKEMGIVRVFVDVISEKNTDHPQLRELMDAIHEGDTVTVSDITRFSQKTRDAWELDLVKQLASKDVLCGFVNFGFAPDKTRRSRRFLARNEERKQADGQ